MRFVFTENFQHLSADEVAAYRETPGADLDALYTVNPLFVVRYSVLYGEEISHQAFWCNRGEVMHFRCPTSSVAELEVGFQQWKSFCSAVAQFFLGIPLEQFEKDSWRYARHPFASLIDTPPVDVPMGDAGVKSINTAVLNAGASGEEAEFLRWVSRNFGDHDHVELWHQLSNRISWTVPDNGGMVLKH